MTEFETFKKAFINAGYDIEEETYGDFNRVITIKKLQLSFEFESDKLQYIYNEKGEDYILW